MRLYRRILRAGRLEKIVVYTRPIPTKDHRVRAARKNATRIAQRFVNRRQQVDKLAMLLAANFDRADSVFCTLTFSAEELPKSRAEVKKRFARFAKRMRDSMGGKRFEYVRAIEGEGEMEQPEEIEGERVEEGETRLHIHMITNMYPAQWEMMRREWPFGHVYIQKINCFRVDSFTRLSAYITKAAADGSLKNGECAYSASKGLERPSVSGEWVDEDDIEIPQDADIITDSFDGTSRWSYCHRVMFIKKIQGAKIRNKKEQPHQIG